MLVTIIINNHNYGRFLADAIDSALAQSHEPIEVIVVDDGSVDNSREVIQQYGDRVLPVYQKQQGQAAALNAGYARARGDVVIFLDADDILHAHTAAAVADAFANNPALAKVTYPLQVIDSAGRPTGEIRPEPHLDLSQGDLRRQVLTFPFDLTWAATSGNAFAARVLERMMPVPEADYRILADYYLSLVALLFGTVAALEKVGGSYRVHGANNHANGSDPLNLPRIRQILAHATTTCYYIRHQADRLQLAYPSEKNTELLSVSLIAQRLISLKLDPESHPHRGDTPWQLVRMGTEVALQRFDVMWPMRLAYVSWMAGMALAPYPVSRWLAERFLDPGKRPRLNPLLRSLQRSL